MEEALSTFSELDRTLQTQRRATSARLSTSAWCLALSSIVPPSLRTSLTSQRSPLYRPVSGAEPLVVAPQLVVSTGVPADSDEAGFVVLLGHQQGASLPCHDAVEVELVVVASEVAAATVALVVAMTVLSVEAAAAAAFPPTVVPIVVEPASGLSVEVAAAVPAVELARRSGFLATSAPSPG